VIKLVTKQIQGTILSINNKVNSKGVPFSILKISDLEGKEIDLFLWQNNFKLINKFANFEIESTIKDDKTYNSIITMDVI
jgi:hypothetical protein